MGEDWEVFFSAVEEVYTNIPGDRYGLLTTYPFHKLNYTRPTIILLFSISVLTHFSLLQVDTVTTYGIK